MFENSLLLRGMRFLTIISMVCVCLPSMSQVDSIGEKKMVMNINGSLLKIPYFSNYSLDTSNYTVAQAVIVVHGTNRNADDYFANMSMAASMRPAETDSLIIIAPQFLTEVDIDSFSLDNEHLYWSNGGWKSGSKSKDNVSNPRPERISSYAVLDTIMMRLALNFPNLRSIIFTGHSAGGQVTNRYSATTPVAGKLCKQFGISTKFIVANPGSYLYLDEKRRVSGTIDQFSIPETSCSSYNDWKYGLDNLYAYPSSVGVDSIRSYLSKRQVVYILGENDTATDYLDVSCEAMLQGSNRLQRGTIYFNYLIDFYGSNILSYHSVDTIPGVGHNNYEMYTSNKGLHHLFESYPNSCEDITSGITLPSDGIPLNISIYPNPASGLIEIHSNHNNASITIYNIWGRMVKKAENISGTYEQIDISDLIDGVYILEYYADSNRIKKRILKIH